jgi:hypothetical protein
LCDTRRIARLIIPMPNWDDYLRLAFDEIRQYGATSVQVMRRLSSALLGLMSSLPAGERANAVQRCIEPLDLAAVMPGQRRPARCNIVPASVLCLTWIKSTTIAGLHRMIVWGF